MHWQPFSHTETLPIKASTPLKGPHSLEEGSQVWSGADTEPELHRPEEWITFDVGRHCRCSEITKEAHIPGLLPPLCLLCLPVFLIMEPPSTPSIVTAVSVCWASGTREISLWETKASQHRLSPSPGIWAADGGYCPMTASLCQAWYLLREVKLPRNGLASSEFECS
jgi:hypothetical protein